MAVRAERGTQLPPMDKPMGEQVSIPRVRLHVPFYLPFGNTMIFTISGLETSGQITRTETGLSATLEEYPHANHSERHELDADRTSLVALEVAEQIYIGMDRDVVPVEIGEKRVRGFVYDSWRKLDGTPDMFPDPMEIVANPIPPSVDISQVKFMLIDITISDKEANKPDKELDEEVSKLFEETRVHSAIL